MCDVNGPFKLCTCNTNVDKSKPYWVLHRYIQSREDILVNGIFSQPNPYQNFSLRSLKRRMNSNNVFDFDYTPNEGDLLELFLSPKLEEEFGLAPDYEVEYYEGKWRVLKEFEFVKYKHSSTQAGVIDGPVTELTAAYKRFRNTPEGRKWEYFNLFDSNPIVPYNLNTKQGLLNFLKDQTGL
jgi:hypothetical protein